MTTVRLPLHDIGYKAGELIIDMLEGKNIRNGEEVIAQVPCRLQIRKSVKNVC